MTELSALPSLPRLTKYELLEEIGHGGMATVYRARDKRLGREVAIKIIHKHLRENAEVAKRFIAEARAAAKLRHPCIVEVHDVSGDEDAERYLVVELCRGTTLRKVIEQHQEMPAEIGAAMTAVLCDALDHAHASGIIHRDVKPENVLVELPSDRKSLPQARASAPGDEQDVEPESSRRPISKRRPETNEERPGSRRVSAPSDTSVTIKLTDFGIAKLLDAQGVTSTGQVLGSPAHMAPEQIEAGEVDGRTDVFALGVLMYECLVGHLPFEGKNPAQVLRRVLEGTYPPADRERNTVGGRWSRIIDGALAHRLEDRTASPAKFGERIRDELEALGIQDPRAEIDAYFADPADYVRRLPERLVPKLLARGETARKTGDVVGAADDFNRALALAPHDQSIFKRVRGLRSSAARRQYLVRGAAVVGALALLGVVAFGVARLRKPDASLLPDRPDERPTASPETSTNVGAPKDPSTGEGVPPSASVGVVEAPGPATSVRLKLPPALLSAAQQSAPRASTRKVSIIITPPGAKLTLDGREEAWFSRIFSLRTGTHQASATVEGSKCCEPYDGIITVEAPPENDPEHVQRIGIRLKPLPATVSLNGAPANAQLVCADVMLTVFAGASKSVQLRDATWSGKCQFIPPPPAAPTRSSVLLRAGEHNAISWP